MPSNSKEYQQTYMKSYLNDPEKGGKLCKCEDCGYTYKKYDKTRHLKTKKHLGVEEKRNKSTIEELMVEVAELKKLLKK